MWDIVGHMGNRVDNTIMQHDQRPNKNFRTTNKLEISLVFHRHVSEESAIVEPEVTVFYSTFVLPNSLLFFFQGPCIYLVHHSLLFHQLPPSKLT